MTSQALVKKLPLRLQRGNSLTSSTTLIFFSVFLATSFTTEATQNILKEILIR
jgi:hypothetical protein